MLSYTFDIGPNVVAAISLICSAIAAVYARNASKEQKPNGGGSQRDAINRTESTVRALAVSLGVAHPVAGSPTGVDPVTGETEMIVHDPAADEVTPPEVIAP